MQTHFAVLGLFGHYMVPYSIATSLPRAQVSDHPRVDTDDWAPQSPQANWLYLHYAFTSFAVPWITVSAHESPSIIPRQYSMDYNSWPPPRPTTPTALPPYRPIAPTAC